MTGQLHLTQHADLVSVLRLPKTGFRLELKRQLGVKYVRMLMRACAIGGIIQLDLHRVRAPWWQTRSGARQARRRLGSGPEQEGHPIKMRMTVVVVFKTRVLLIGQTMSSGSAVISDLACFKDEGQL